MNKEEEGESESDRLRKRECLREAGLMPMTCESERVLQALAQVRIVRTFPKTFLSGREWQAVQRSIEATTTSPFQPKILEGIDHSVAISSAFNLSFEHLISRNTSFITLRQYGRDGPFFIATAYSIYSG